MRPTIDARTGLEIIPPDDCRQLLAADEIGRLAIVDGGTPAVFPVNYVFDGRSVVFRPPPGTKLSSRGAARRRSRSMPSTASTAPGGAWWSPGRLEEVTELTPARDRVAPRSSRGR